MPESFNQSLPQDGVAQLQLVDPTFFVDLENVSARADRPGLRGALFRLIRAYIEKSRRFSLWAIRNGPQMRLRKLSPSVRWPAPNRSIDVTNGILTVRHGERILGQAPLAKWHWWEAKSLGKKWRRMGFPDTDILVVVPQNYQWRMADALMGADLCRKDFQMGFCGFTEEARKRWLALFLIAGVSKAYGLDA